MRQRGTFDAGNDYIGLRASLTVDTSRDWERSWHGHYAPRKRSRPQGIRGEVSVAAAWLSTFDAWSHQGRVLSGLWRCCQWEESGIGDEDEVGTAERDWGVLVGMADTYPGTDLGQKRSKVSSAQLQLLHARGIFDAGSKLQ